MTSVKSRVRVVGMRTPLPDDVEAIDTTSHSHGLWKQLSPFFLGPCKLWGGHVAENVENAWQYSKAYDPQHFTNGKFDRAKWLAWASEGWKARRAHRYPMGRGAAPAFSVWGDETYFYTEARARIYVPLYARAVRRTEAFRNLQTMYADGDTIYLRDFDGYDREEDGSSLIQVMTNPRKKMGHAFVLAMMLEWGEFFWRR